MRIKHAIKSHHHAVQLHCGWYLCAETRMCFHILSFFFLSLISLALFSLLHMYVEWVCVFSQINDKKSQLEIIFRINWNIEYVIEHNLIKIQMIPYRGGGKSCMWFCVFICTIFYLRFDGIYSNEWQKMCNKASKHIQTQLSQVWQI